MKQRYDAIPLVDMKPSLNERRAAYAPELDPAAHAPEVCYDRTDPELSVDRTAPWLIHDNAELEPLLSSRLNEIEKQPESGLRFKRLSLRKWRTIFFFVVSTLCIASLSIGLSNRPATQDLPSPLKHGIINGSSFAATITPEGSRHIFFQDIDGNLRQAVMDARGDRETWHFKNIEVSYQGPGFIELPAARKLTPLTCFSRYLGEPSDNTWAIYLFYLDSMNQITIAGFNPFIGWINGRSAGRFGTPFMDSSSLSLINMSVHSQSLAATPVSAYLGMEMGILLMFHDVNEVPTLFYASEQKHKIKYASGPVTTITLKWTNLTEKLSTLLARRGVSLERGDFSNFGRTANPASVFAHMNVLTTQMQDPRMTTPFTFTVTASENLSLAPSLDAADGYLTIFNEPDIPPPFFFLTTYPPRDWPIGYVGLYNIQNGSLTYTRDRNLPTLYDQESRGVFPFTNVASISPSNYSRNEVFIYHQINESTFAEEKYDADTFSWSSTMIEIS